MGDGALSETSSFEKLTAARLSLCQAEPAHPTLAPNSHHPRSAAASCLSLSEAKKTSVHHQPLSKAHV